MTEQNWFTWHRDYADLVLVCGVFGNVTGADIAAVTRRGERYNALISPGRPTRAGPFDICELKFDH